MTPDTDRIRELDRAMREAAERRRALRWLAAGGTAAALPGVLRAQGGASGTGLSASGTGRCAPFPPETPGPFPADGTSASGRRHNALALAGAVRRDIRRSVGGPGGIAPGVPLRLRLELVEASASCAPLAGRAVYVWHCTRDGRYSLYSDGVTGENYLRGVQVSDAAGVVEFMTVFPGCYPGRWPHVHFEVYPSLATATDASAVGDYATVSQLALQAAACREVYGSASGYSASAGHLAGLALERDFACADDRSGQQLAAVSGDQASGLLATLRVALSG
jgi:protocatechuate 3,4-dioxygenase beta subunit